MLGSKNLRVRVSCLLLKRKKILLISHIKEGNIYWLLPGGGVNFGESLDEALKREIKEELNISVKVKQPVLICDSIDSNGGRHILNICFACSYLKGEYSLGEEERLHNFSFFSQEELKKLVIYPPLKKDLIAYMNLKEQKNIYKGKVWID